MCKLDLLVRQAILAILLCFSSVSLFSCATPALKIDLSSDATINTSSDGQSFSVLLRFYQLSDPAIFERSDYDALWRDAAGVLGVTLLDEKELMVEPSTSLSLSLTKHDAAEYLGIVAYFREHESADWKAYKKLNHGVIKADTRMEIELTGNQLFLAYQ